MPDGIVFQTSQSTDKLDAALAKVQGAVKTAPKMKTNPHFGSKYADLAAVWDTCRKLLSENGVSVTQWPIFTADIQLVQLATRIACEGQYILGVMSIPVQKANAHGYGAAITYARRYALASVVGIVADEDDDANAAVDEKLPENPFPQPDQYGPLDAIRTCRDISDLKKLKPILKMAPKEQQAELKAAYQARKAELEGPDGEAKQADDAPGGGA